MAETREGVAHLTNDIIMPMAGVGVDGSWKAFPLAGIETNPFTADEINTPASNTAAVLSWNAPGVGFANALGGVAWSYSAAPTGGRLTIADGSDTVFDLDITGAGPGSIVFTPPRRGRTNRAMTVTLAAAAVVGKINALSHWTQPVPLIGVEDFSDEANSQMEMLF